MTRLLFLGLALALLVPGMASTAAAQDREGYRVYRSDRDRDGDRVYRYERDRDRRDWRDDRRRRDRDFDRRDRERRGVIIERRSDCPVRIEGRCVIR